LTDTALARRAEALAARLPPLLARSPRVASTVVAGAHARRRVGPGSSFWQFRPFAQGDAPGAIDSRASAKSDRAYVRQTEWELAQTVHVWRDGSASMEWRSAPALPTKAERTALLVLAVAALLLRGGERVRSLGGPPTPTLDRLAEALDRQVASGVPGAAAIPAHGRLLLAGDFLAPLHEIEAAIRPYATRPVRGHVIQVLDPAELSLPYQGRVRFRGLEGEGDTTVAQVEGVRTAYAAAIAAQQDGLRAICDRAGWTCTLHCTANPPETALLALYEAIA